MVRCKKWSGLRACPSALPRCRPSLTEVPAICRFIHNRFCLRRFRDNSFCSSLHGTLPTFGGDC